MKHCPPEQLALAALREPLPAGDAAHLDSCAQCRSEVAGLRRAVDAVAIPEFAASGPAVAPPASVWDSIAAATGVATAPRPREHASTPPAPVTLVPAPRREKPTDGAQVVPFRSRRPRLLMVAAAAVVGAAVGAGVVAALDRAVDAEPITSIALDPLEGRPTSGSAAVVVRDDGSRALQVDLDAPTLDDGYYEIWLIEPGIVDMVPLGVLRPGEQTFELPTGLDLGEYPIVDISVEPLDGDPTHSGVSVARGQLDA